MTKKLGRPRAKKNAVKNRMLVIRLSPTQEKKMLKAAGPSPLSSWARGRLLDSIEKPLPAGAKEGEIQP